MQVRRVVGVLALALVTGWSTASAAAPAAAEAAPPRHGSVAGESREAPREVHLVVGTPPSIGHFTLRAVADDWAAGRRVVLQRRTPDGWTNVAPRRFSPAGTARWQVPVPARRATYRAVTRAGGERIVSTSVRFS